MVVEAGNSIEGGTGVAAQWRESFEEAASELLDTTLALEAGEADLAAVAGALEACTRAGALGGLRGVRYLESLLLPLLRRDGGEPGPLAREALERLAHLLVAFAAGALEPDEAPDLLVALSAVPGIVPLPESFQTIIAERLREDARLLGRGPERAEQPAGPLACARDELEMLAQEMARFGAEVCPQLLAIDPPEDGEVGDAGRQGRGRSGERLRAWQDALDEIGLQLRHLRNAAGYLALGPLAQWAAHAQGQIEALLAGGRGPDELLRVLLLPMPSLLEGYFRAPDPDSATELAVLLTQEGWPEPMSAEQADSIAAALGALRVIDSRRIGWRSEEIDAESLSLELPADADAKVVDHLLRELPQLAGQFTQLVESLGDGASEALEPAQRVAHTLKGTANTVGVAGIANLTHQLEDLLQLLGRDARGGNGESAPMMPDGATVDVLLAASDCLADMCDAVDGRGEAPSNAAEIYRSVVRATNRLLGAPPPAQAAPAVAGERELPHDELVLEPPAFEPDVPAFEPDVRGFEANAPAITGDAAEMVAHGDESGAGAPIDELAVAQPLAGEQGAPGAVAADEGPGGSPGEYELEAVSRVPMSLLERLLELTGEAAIALAQAQERTERLAGSQRALRVEGEQLESLAWELDRLVDLRGAALTGHGAGARSGFDPLELDEYNELHMVSRRIAEAGADNKLLDTQIAEDLAELREALAHLERLNAALHQTLFQTRLTPVASVAPRLRRALRQAARLAGKEVVLNIEGEQTQVDDELLQKLLDPLMHLLRNAVDHGIEPASVRDALGKPAHGSVGLRFERSGATLTVHCTDDGRGLDLEAIADRARQLGLLEPDRAPERAALTRTIFAAGFSTRAAASQLSGRGIGLDVVQQRVAALGGSVDVAQVPGQGCSFTLTLPQRLATTPVMVARAAGHVLALATAGIRTIAAAGAFDAGLDTPGLARDGATAAVALGGRNMPAIRLERLLGLPERLFAREGARTVAAIVDGTDGEPMAVITPELTPTRHVLLKPLAPYLGRAPGVEGVAVLGDGSVAAVLDLAALVAARDAVPAPVYADEPSRLNAPVCLVVDDAVSVRRSTELFARDLGFEVDTAGDGMEALACVERRMPDLVIVDLEMPRMNGVEFTAALRQRHPGRAPPVIMITSRYSDKHRRLAAEAGVDVFLTKPYTDDDLATHIHRAMQRGLA
ncbi:MAG: response regulator [Burkholderiales bacterium]|nr:MAG: response regulator [Burkholderiales bacterium]